MTYRAKKQLNDMYAAARKAAVDEMVRLAREALARNPSLNEFLIAMGRVFFIDKHGDIVHLSAKPSFRALEELLTDWDNVFKLSGEGIRFTATGPIVTDW